jgi:hypothetical protein
MPRLACQKRLKTQGLAHDTLAPCAPRIETIPSRAVRRACAGALQSQLATATTRGLDQVGLPLRSDARASLCGVAKQPGMGAIKEVGRLARRRPAVCGTPTREEAQPVREIRVAAQPERTSRFLSLTKQRREVLPNPEALERLGAARAPTPGELLPRAKNRSHYQNTVNLSIGYNESYGPGMHRQDGHHRPASAASSGRRERVAAS